MRHEWCEYHNCGIGYPTIFLANGFKISGVEGVNVVMRIDITQLKPVPQRIHPGGKIGLVGRIHIGGVQVYHRTIFWIGFLTIPVIVKP